MANAYIFTLTPEGSGHITFRLVANKPCADGGICAADGFLLSVGLSVTTSAANTPGERAGDAVHLRRW